MPKTKQVTPKFGLCIDWETSGSEWGADSSVKYQGLNLGAVVFNTSTFEPVDTLSALIKFDSKKYKWSKEAEAIHGLTQEFLEQNGVSQEEAAESLLEFIAKYFAGTKVMFMGHNNEFDRRFTNQLLMSIGVEFTKEPSKNAKAAVELHHVSIDTAAVGFVTLGFFKSDLLFDAIGLEASGQHNALQDALMTLETCRRLKIVFSEILKGNNN